MTTTPAAPTYLVTISGPDVYHLEIVTPDGPEAAADLALAALRDPDFGPLEIAEHPDAALSVVSVEDAPEDDYDPEPDFDATVGGHA